MIVKCIPILDDTMWITHNNILHKCIDVVLNPIQINLIGVVLFL